MSMGKWNTMCWWSTWYKRCAKTSLINHSNKDWEHSTKQTKGQQSTRKNAKGACKPSSISISKNHPAGKSRQRDCHRYQQCLGKCGSGCSCGRCSGGGGGGGAGGGSGCSSCSGWSRGGSWSGSWSGFSCCSWCGLRSRKAGEWQDDLESERKVTPPKFNIAPEKWSLEDYFPIGEGNFSGAMLHFGGVTK